MEQHSILSSFGMLSILLLLTVQQATATATGSLRSRWKSSFLEDTKDDVLTLTDIPSDQIASHKAYCLDGSSYKYHFRPALDPAHAKDYVLYFTGGGWCYNEDFCKERAKTPLGSSRNWTDISRPPILLSNNALNNPLFCGYNHVLLGYCDGASFTGNQESPSAENGLWYRGLHNLQAVMEHLFGQPDHPTKEVDNLLITGCSAGGLATYLHADSIRGLFPEAKVKALPESGFFWFHNSVEGIPVYEQELKSVFVLQNSTKGVNSQCIDTLPKEDHYKCISAATTLQFLETPILILNSIYDSWNLACGMAATSKGCSKAPGWSDCLQNGSMMQCNQTQFQSIWDWGDAMLEDVVRSLVLVRPENGVFLHSCWTHCDLSNGGYNHDIMNRLSIDGTSFGQALHDWWFYEELQHDSKYLHRQMPRSLFWPCKVRFETPHQCNPTCPKGTLYGIFNGTFERDWYESVQ